MSARVRDRWDATPLQTRLVVLVAVLLLAGLVLAGVASATLLRQTLVSQVDAKLLDESQAMTSRAASGYAAADYDEGWLSDYCVRIQVGERQRYYQSASSADRYGTPELPAVDRDTATATAGKAFTVTSDVTGSRWRAVALPFSDADGSVVVALPLTDVDTTVRRMTLVVVLTALGIVLLGAVAGGWAVHRSLRPLRDIEDTASAIADGDLSRRVPPAPAGTEVGRLGGALNAMLAQIETAFAARTASESRMRRFVADASHELRTPLATIRGYGELYRMGALRESEQVDDTMRRIEDSATRMGGLVEDLLSLARLDESRPARTGPVDLTVLAADAISDLHALDPTRSTRLVALPEGGAGAPARVTGDEARLRQVVANLVGNVVRHTPAGTPVELAVGPVDGRAVLEVRDHGPGIPAEHAARVFERFYRVDASRGRAEGGGAGLGMAIVAAIVEAHAGTVELAQTPGGGTTVRVVLPGSAPDPADDVDGRV